MAVDKAFVEDYYDLANDVRHAGYQSITQRLGDWLALVDDEPQAATLVRSLAKDFDFSPWYAALTVGAEVKGATVIEWSRNRREKLGQQLALFRHFAATPDEVLQFALRFYHAGPKLDDNVRKVNEELFDPMARDLIKEIERASSAASRSDTAPPNDTAPGSDRIVRLDDNYATAEHLRVELDNIAVAVEQSNQLAADVEGRDQALAELRAGRTLMGATRVRAAAIAETLLPSLKWIGEKAAGTLIALAVGAVLTLIATLFGFHIPKP